MLSFLKQVFNEFSQDNCPRMAAALSYYTAFAIAPLMILLLLLAGLIFDPADVKGQIEEQISGAIGPDGAEQVKTMLKSASTPEEGNLPGSLSAIGLLFGASGVVVQLQNALNETWGVMPDPNHGGIWNFVTKRLLSIGMVLGLAFVLIVSLAVSALISALDQRLVAWLPEWLGTRAASGLDIAFTLVVLTVLFASIFKVLPDAMVRWRDVGLGAILTAVLFVLGKFAMGMYLGSKNMESTFGSAGSFALILLWVYYSAMILLFGAEFTQVWSKRRGRGIQPLDGAVKVEKRVTSV